MLWAFKASKTRSPCSGTYLAHSGQDLKQYLTISYQDIESAILDSLYWLCLQVARLFHPLWNKVSHNLTQFWGRESFALWSLEASKFPCRVNVLHWMISNFLLKSTSKIISKLELQQVSSFVWYYYWGNWHWYWLKEK